MPVLILVQLPIVGGCEVLALDTTVMSPLLLLSDGGAFAPVAFALACLKPGLGQLVTASGTGANAHRYVAVISYPFPADTVRLELVHLVLALEDDVLVGAVVDLVHEPDEGHE